MSRRRGRTSEQRRDESEERGRARERLKAGDNARRLTLSDELRFPLRRIAGTDDTMPERSSVPREIIPLSDDYVDCIHYPLWWIQGPRAKAKIDREIIVDSQVEAYRIAEQFIPKKWPYLFKKRHCAADLAHFLCADFEQRMVMNNTRQDKLVDGIDDIPELAAYWGEYQPEGEVEEIIYQLLNVFDKYLFMDTLGKVNVVFRPFVEGGTLGYTSDDGREIRIYTSPDFRIQSYICTLMHEMVHAFLLLYGCSQCQDLFAQVGFGGHAYAWTRIMLTFLGFWKLPGLVDKVRPSMELDHFWADLGAEFSRLRFRTVTENLEDFVEQVLIQWGIPDDIVDETVIPRICMGWRRSMRQRALRPITWGESGERMEE